MIDKESLTGKNACNSCGKMFAHRVSLWKHRGVKHERIANLMPDPHPNSSLEKHFRLHLVGGGKIKIDTHVQ